MDTGDDDGFEWLVEWKDLAPLFAGKASVWAGSSGIVVGCGSSNLAASAKRDMGLGRVHSVDRRESDIADMRQKYKHDRTLTWETIDWSNEAEAQKEQHEKFDIAFDKSTLDCVLANDGSCADLASFVFAKLERGGVYFVVSLYPPELLIPLLTRNGEMGFDELEVHCIRRGPAPPVSAIFFQRNETILPKRELQQRQREILDAYFKQANPLTFSQAQLTSIRSAFEARSRIPLGEAYILLFEEALRREYSLEDFCEDLATFREKAGLTSPSFSISQPESMAFLAESQ